MERSAWDAPHDPPRRPAAAGRAGRFVVRHCVLPLWRSLTACGLMFLGMVGHDEPPGRPVPGTSTLRGRPRACEGSGPEAATGPAPAFAGLPPGHPERLRPDVPFTEAERALARQLIGLRTDDGPAVD